jgi:hypothetical protein|nr:MAG TPA: hypothetical protein [Caudoviricetes sp.]
MRCPRSDGAAPASRKAFKGWSLTIGNGGDKETCALFALTLTNQQIED